MCPKSKFYMSVEVTHSRLQSERCSSRCSALKEICLAFKHILLGISLFDVAASGAKFSFGPNF